MVNAWSLLYEELNGTMDEVYPVMTDNTITPQESDEYDPIVGSGNTAAYTVSDGADYINLDMGDIGNITLNTDECDHQFDIAVPPTPGIQRDCNRKYKEDESIKALQDYISTTYGLSLIHI